MRLEAPVEETIDGPRRRFRQARLGIRVVRALTRIGYRAGRGRERIRPRAGGPGDALALVAAGAALGVTGAYFLDPESGRRRRDAARGRLVALWHRHEELNDAELANKVRSEIFRDHHASKGRINVNSEHGVVYLRGQLPDPEEIRELVKAARGVGGVRGVASLLQTP